MNPCDNDVVSKLLYCIERYRNWTRKRTNILLFHNGYTKFNNSKNSFHQIGHFDMKVVFITIMLLISTYSNSNHTSSIANIQPLSLQSLIKKNTCRKEPKKQWLLFTVLWFSIKGFGNDDFMLNWSVCSTVHWTIRKSNTFLLYAFDRLAK